MLDWLRRLFGLHVHEWGKWETHEGECRRMGRMTISLIRWQERECNGCGVIEAREIHL